MSFSHDSKLGDISAKVKMGERLSFDDGLALFHTEDLNALGKLADTVRRQKHGRTTYFNVNRHFNPTNVCYVDCKFCGFYRTPRQPDAYTHNIDDSLKIAGQAINEGATELHITGGLNTKLPFSYFTDLLTSLKKQYPQLHLKAFTMVEVDHMVRLREQQDKSGGFQCFIPLAFYPENTQLAHLPGPSGIDSLKTMAVSRLMLDNFAHIKAYWVMLGKHLAQVALHFGANDVDGTITEGGELTESYSIESNNEVKMTKPELIGLIEEAGFEAVERDTVYNRIEKVA